MLPTTTFHQTSPDKKLTEVEKCTCVCILKFNFKSQKHAFCSCVGNRINSASSCSDELVLYKL